MIKQFYFKQFYRTCYLFPFSLNVKQFYLTHRSDHIRCYLGAIAMKGYSTFPKIPVQEPHHQIVLCHIQNTHWWSLTPLQRCSLCILSPSQLGFSIMVYIIGNRINNARLFAFHIMQILLEKAWILLFFPANYEYKDCFF